MEIFEDDKAISSKILDNLGKRYIGLDNATSTQFKKPFGPPIIQRKVLETDPSEIKQTSSSDFIISVNGGLSESWAKTCVYPSKIIEVGRETIILELLTDFETKKFELKKFKRSLLEGKIDITSDLIVLVKTFERPGKFVFEFEEAKPGLYDQYFVIDNSDIENIDPSPKRKEKKG